MSFATVIGYFDETDYENTLPLIKHLKLNIHTSESTVDSYFLRSFLSDGIKIEKSST